MCVRFIGPGGFFTASRGVLALSWLNAKVLGHSIGRETTEKATENSSNSPFMLFITHLFVFLFVRRRGQVRKLTRDKLIRYI